MDHVRYCAHCGVPSRDGQFCVECGTALVTSTEPAAPASPPPPSEELSPSPAGGIDLTWISWDLLRSRPGRIGVTVAIGLVAVVGAGGFLAHRAPTKTVTGALFLEDIDSTSGLSIDDACSGASGYEDIVDGAQGVLEDGDGSTLATSTLSGGIYDGVACVFHFAFGDVPKAGFYVLRIGRTARDDLRYSHQTLVDQDWALNLSLGE